jgi:hypothetical protein
MIKSEHNGATGQTCTLVKIIRDLEGPLNCSPGCPGDPPQEDRPSGLAGNCSLLRHQYDRLFVLLILCTTAHLRRLPLRSN